MPVLQKRCQNLNPPVFIVVGTSGSGKTTFLRNLKNSLQKENISVGGIIAEGTWKNNQRDTFELIDLLTDEKIRFCQREQKKDWESIGPFYINPRGQSFGDLALSVKFLQGCQVIIIDEIGPFELQGKGWAKSFERILTEKDFTIVISVREKLLKEIIQYWNLNVIAKIQASEHLDDQFIESIKTMIS